MRRLNRGAAGCKHHVEVPAQFVRTFPDAHRKDDGDRLTVRCGEGHVDAGPKHPELIWFQGQRVLFLALLILNTGCSPGAR